MTSGEFSGDGAYLGQKLDEAMLIINWLSKLETS